MLTKTKVTKSREKRTRDCFGKNSQKAFREFPSFPFPLRAALDRGEPSERKLDGNIPPRIPPPRSGQKHPSTELLLMTGADEMIHQRLNFGDGLFAPFW